MSEVAAERERQARAIQTIAASVLDLSRGNLKPLQPILAALPASTAFSRLEIRGKSGKLLDLPLQEPDWLQSFGLLPSQEPLEIPLERGGLTIRLVPSALPAFPYLTTNALLILPAFLSGILLGAALWWRTRTGGKLDERRWSHVLSPSREAQQRQEVSPVRQTSGEASDSIEHLPAAIVRCHRDGHVLSLNAAAKTLLGYAGSIQSGQSFIDLIAPWERSRVAEIIGKPDSGDTGRTLTTQALVAKGGVLPVFIDLASTPGEPGELVLGIRDDSETQTVRAALELRSCLLDDMGYGAAILSPNDGGGRVIYGNRAFHDLLRLPRESGHGDLVRCIAAWDAAAAEQLQALLARPPSTRSRLSLKTSANGDRWLDLELIPVTLGSGSDPLLACEIRDRTEEMLFRADAERRLSLQHYILEGMPFGLCTVDSNGKVLEINLQLAKFTGRTREQMLAAAMDDWLGQDARKVGSVIQGEVTIRSEEGDRTAKVSTLKPAAADGRQTYVYLFEDITAYKRNAQEDDAEISRLRQILDEIAVGVITTNAGGYIQFFNSYAQRLSGTTEHEFKGMLLEQIIHLIDEKKREPLADPAMRAMRIGKTVKFRQNVLLVGANKRELAVDLSATPIRDSRNNVTGCVVVLRDVSEQRSLTQQMTLRASRDPLTGLINRRELLSQLEMLQCEIDELNRRHTLCYMDLDRFKIINDTCGHNAGDELLRQISELMSKCLRANDILARIGGDEFCAVLRDTAGDSAAVVAEKVREAVKEFRFAWDGKYFDVGVSIGIFSLLPGLTVEETINAADEACYVAKELGRDMVWIATNRVESDKPISTPWNERLAAAVEHDYFELYMQDAWYLQPDPASHPIYREVLPRLHEPGRASLTASAFMPSARRFNLTAVIERWVIGKLFSSLSNFEREADVYAIQLSPATLGESGFLTFLLAQCRQYRIKPSTICVEIGEDELVQNFSLVQKFMRDCTEYGFRFCLNQFGGGISSFAYIRSLPLAFLKIDPSLTRDLESDAVNEAVVRAILDIGKRLNILTITHLTDTGALDRLRMLGVHYVQGPGLQDLTPLAPSAHVSS